MSDTGQEPIPDTQEVEGQPTVQEQPNTGQDAPLTLEAAMAEIKRLQGEVSKTNSEAAKWRTDFRKAEKAKTDAEAAALAEQGKYKELYELATPKLSEYDMLKERYDAVIAAVQETNAKRIKAIPEAMQSLVPEYDDPLKTAAWLDANSAVFQKPQAPGLDGRAGGRGSATVSDEAVAEFASRMGIRPEHVDRAALAGMYNER